MEKLSISLKSLIDGLDFDVVKGEINDIDIIDLSYDTRNVSAGYAFICIKGEKYDSHMDIQKLIDEGAKLIVIDKNYIKNVENIDAKNAAVIAVDNTRKALSILSRNYFRKPDEELYLIGVTGTKGKTTTTNIIKQILDMCDKPCGLIGTIGVYIKNKHYNLDNTTPESYIIYKYLREMVDNNIKYACMEVSSQSYKLDRVYGLNFNEAIFTNIYEDHIGEGEHKDFDEYFNCKKEIINNCDHLIINHNMLDIENIRKMCEKKNIGYEEVDTSESKYENIETDKYFGVNFMYEGDKYDLSIPGKYNVENAIFAIKALGRLNIDKKDIINNMNKISIPGRNEIIYKNDDFTILVDFAHNELGTINLFDTMKTYNKKRYVVVFGCGGNRDKERRYGMGRVCGKLADKCIITADNSRYEKTMDIINDILTTLTKETDNYETFEYRVDAINYAIDTREKGDIIMVIGKGGEEYNDFNGKKTPYSDSAEIKKILKEKNII